MKEMDICVPMNRSISRRLTILDLLVQSTDIYVSIETLVHTTGASRKTIDKDINELNKDLRLYSSTMGIKITGGKKMHLFFKNRREIEQFTLDQVKETAQFYFTTKLFYENHILLKHAQVERHFSPSNIFRLWRIYANHLSNWDLYLDKASVKKLTGKELHIRYYFFNYYWTLFQGIEWPFEQMNPEKIIQSVQNFSAFLPEKLTSIECEKIAYWVAIIRVRNSLDKSLNKGSISSWCKMDKRKWIDVLPTKGSFSSFLGIDSNDKRIEEEILFFYSVMLKEVPSVRLWLLEALGLKMKKTGVLLSEVLPLQAELLEQEIGHTSQYKSLQSEIVGLWILALVWGDYPLRFSGEKLLVVPENPPLFDVEQLLYPDFVTTCLFLGVKKNKKQFEVIYKKANELVTACLPKKKIVAHFLVEAPFVKQLQLKEKLGLLNWPFHLVLDKEAKPDLILTNITFIYSNELGNTPVYYVRDIFTEHEQKNLIEFCCNQFLGT